MILRMFTFNSFYCVLYTENMIFINFDEQQLNFQKILD